MVIDVERFRDPKNTKLFIVLAEWKKYHQLHIPSI